MRNDNAGKGTRGLRAEKSKALLDAIRVAYGIEFSDDIVDLGGSSSLNLRLANGTENWVVRVYRPYVTKLRMEGIRKVRKILTAKDISCDAVIQTLDGKPEFEFEGRCVEVERFVIHDSVMNTWESLSVGMPILARMHTILENVELSDDCRFPRFANYLAPEQLLLQTMVAVSRMRSWIPTTEVLEAAELTEQLVKTGVNLNQKFVGAFPRQIVQGDFWDTNVLLRSGKVVFVTDFDFMGERTRVDDLALTLFFACMRYRKLSTTGDLVNYLRQMLEAYNMGADTPLSRDERKALLILIAQQPLWSMGGWVAQLDDECTAQTHALSTVSEVRWGLRMLEDIRYWTDALC